jgi:hypothetical protein
MEMTPDQQHESNGGDYFHNVKGMAPGSAVSDSESINQDDR